MRFIFYFVATGVIVIFVALLAARLIFFQDRNLPPILDFQRIHLYKNPTTVVENVRVFAFYAVPSDRAEAIYPGWRDLLFEALQRLSRFHEIQFVGKSHIQYDVFPEPIILDDEGGAYDAASPLDEHHVGLRRAFEEFERELTDPAGNDKVRKFLGTSRDQYRTLVFLYEGAGAYGKEGLAAISRRALTDSRYSAFGDSWLYHQFAHALGLPDQQDSTTGLATSDDIMGLGRHRPLDLNYIAPELTRGMGLVD